MSADRMLTLAGDGSAKFWEVRQDGTDLTIRYGKMGATGRTQVKAYETAEAATAAAGKLVAEKLRKGYTEDETVAAPEPVGAAGNEPVAAEDEDRLTMPAAWLRALYPRRGGTKVAVKQPDPAAPGQLATRLEGHRQRLLDSLAQVRDPELAAAGTAYLAGAPAATPLGAAVVVASLAQHDRELGPLIAEAWLAEHGPVFAAVAVTELASLELAYDRDDWRVRRVADDEFPQHWWGWDRIGIYTRVRAALAAEPDAGYALAVEALAASREAGLHHRVAASFLAPTEVAWVTADCAEVDSVNPRLAFHLMAAISTPEQLALIAGHVHAYSVLHSLALPATLIDGVGLEALPLLAGLLDDAYSADNERRLLGVLAELPSDAAMRALLDRLDRKYTQPAFMRAAARFPAGRCGCWPPPAARPRTCCCAPTCTPIPTWCPRCSRLSETPPPNASTSSRTPRRSPPPRSRPCPRCWSARPGRVPVRPASRPR
ncbi:WGR domain-containing protein [Nonomuraea rubra]|uniref:WGR domain-containing protein n=1 Tax=Nonomuraea rubra TaxID=46180 RepID=UPI00360E509C